MCWFQWSDYTHTRDEAAGWEAGTLVMAAGNSVGAETVEVGWEAVELEAAATAAPMAGAHKPAESAEYQWCTCRRFASAACLQGLSSRARCTCCESAATQG